MTSSTSSWVSFFSRLHNGHDEMSQRDRSAPASMYERKYRASKRGRLIAMVSEDACYTCPLVALCMAGSPLMPVRHESRPFVHPDGFDDTQDKYTRTNPYRIRYCRRCYAVFFSTRSNRETPSEHFVCMRLREGGMSFEGYSKSKATQWDHLRALILGSQGGDLWAFRKGRDPIQPTRGCKKAKDGDDCAAWLKNHCKEIR